MFERFSQSLGSFFSSHDAHGEYLSSSHDLADLERRMRQIEEEDHAYSMHFCGEVGQHRDGR
jgi:hypothetical protein